MDHCWRSKFPGYTPETSGIYEVSSVESDDGITISKNSKVDSLRKFGDPIWEDFKKLKLNVDIPPVHIFDLVISPKFCEIIMAKTTNTGVEMEGVD